MLVNDLLNELSDDGLDTLIGQASEFSKSILIESWPRRGLGDWGVRGTHERDDWQLVNQRFFFLEPVAGRKFVCVFCYAEMAFLGSVGPLRE